MKILKIVVLTAALAMAAAPGLADARGGRGWHGGHYGGHYSGHYGGHYGGYGLGFALGVPLLAAALLAPRYYAPAYYPPTYAYPQDYAYPQQTYIQPPPAAQPEVSQPANAWYFCRSSNAYYPYVRQCAEDWQQVSPTPPR